jgi:hypothetical protein
MAKSKFLKLYTRKRVFFNQYGEGKGKSALDYTVLVRCGFDGDQTLHHLCNNFLLVLLVLLCNFLEFLLSFRVNSASVA